MPYVPSNLICLATYLAGVMIKTFQKIEVCYLNVDKNHGALVFNGRAVDSQKGTVV